MSTHTRHILSTSTEQNQPVEPKIKLDTDVGLKRALLEVQEHRRKRAEAEGMVEGAKRDASEL